MLICQFQKFDERRRGARVCPVIDDACQRLLHQLQIPGPNARRPFEADVGIGEDLGTRTSTDTTERLERRVQKKQEYTVRGFACCGVPEYSRSRQKLSVAAVIHLCSQMDGAVGVIEVRLVVVAFLVGVSIHRHGHDEFEGT